MTKMAQVLSYDILYYSRPSYYFDYRLSGVDTFLNHINVNRAFQTFPMRRLKCTCLE